MLPGNTGMANEYLREFKQLLEHRCLYKTVAGAHEERWAPDVRRLLQETDALERRTTSALILEGIYATVENLTSRHDRRHGRWLMGIWTSRLQREIGGLVLDYYETRSLEEMQCVRYPYVPIPHGGATTSQTERDHRNDELPCADQTMGGPGDARRAYCEWRLWSPFTPPDTWRWN